MCACVCVIEEINFLAIHKTAILHTLIHASLFSELIRKYLSCLQTVCQQWERTIELFKSEREGERGNKEERGTDRKACVCVCGLLGQKMGVVQTNFTKVADFKHYIMSPYTASHHRVFSDFAQHSLYTSTPPHTHTQVCHP